MSIRQSSPALGDQVLLYFHPTMEKLAKAIAGKCDGQSKVFSTIIVVVILDL